MKIVGITSHRAGVHDNSAVLMKDGEVIFAEAEERLSKRKHDGRFPYLAIKESLKLSNTKIKDIDYFVSANPEQSFSKMLFLSLRFIPYVGISRYFKNVLQRLGSKVDKDESGKGTETYLDAGLPPEKLIKVSHYLAHAAAAYYSGPYDDCLVIAMDGFGPGTKGEALSGTIYKATKAKGLEELEKVPVWATLGLYYGAVTKALGFKLNDGEGKTMGLAAYGNPKPCYKKMKDFFPSFKKGEWTIRDSIMDILNIQRENVFKGSYIFKLLESYIKIYGKENVAAACQLVFEEEVLRYVKYLMKKYKEKNLVLVGGIFLNVKANMRIYYELIKEVFVYPNPADGGIAMGAAILGFVKFGGGFERKEILHSAFGREYSDREILAELKKNKKVKYKKLGKDLPKTVAGLLVENKVIGWFQGKGEWGPRALGQRSVMADPRKIGNKDRINDILKGRDWFMPFAPSMLAKEAKKYLKTIRKAPFMIIADHVVRKNEKDIIAATHVDSTVRPQLVTPEANNLYYQVIFEFKKKTGVGVILNTSFNKHGLPIVYSPKDAINHLLWKAIDVLVIGSYLVERKN